MSVVSFFSTSAEIIQMSDRCFDATTTTLIGQAFDRICQELPEGRLDTIGREIIAQRIICLASRGERDPEKMGNEALISVGLKPNRFTIGTLHHRS
jgi:hypothetical protein